MFRNTHLPQKDVHYLTLLKRSARELYLLSMLVFFFSLLGLVFDEFTAQMLTSILHGDETKINSLIWYWERYEGITDVICGLGCLVSAVYMVFSHVKGYYRFPARQLWARIAGK